jgi:CheY-like chemotaxis protein
MPSADEVGELVTGMPRFLLQSGQEPIPGYRLLGPLGRGGFGEVWKCEAPGGLPKALKFVPASWHFDGGAPAEGELRAIHNVKAIRHPFLLSMERVEQAEGGLIIVMELADGNLHEVARREQEAGRPGLPRERLVAYLSDAAEALDLMNVRHDLLHLDVKPQNLFLVSDRVKVGDFGLVSSLGVGSPSAPRFGGLTPLYAAPELFLGSVSHAADQYSLAVVYQQMLTGTTPFQGRNSRQLMVEHVRGTPDLSALPLSDRPHVSRALSKVPADRFPSCSEFVDALLASAARDEQERSLVRSRNARRRVATVLLAEDCTLYRTVLRTTLEGWGFRVVAVADGNAAWEALQKPDAPRLVILDWQLPGLEGVEVCRRLRALSAPEPSYVLILTAREGMVNKLLGLRQGADEYLTKPFVPEELRARLTVGCRIAGVIPGPAKPGPEVRPVRFICTTCGKGLRARAALAGKRVKCPQCGTAVRVAPAGAGGTAHS